MIIILHNIDSKINSESIILKKIKQIKKQKHQIYHIVVFFLIQSIKKFYINLNIFKQATQYYKDFKINKLQDFFFFC